MPALRFILSLRANGLRFLRCSACHSPRAETLKSSVFQERASVWRCYLHCIESPRFGRSCPSRSCSNAYHGRSPQADSRSAFLQSVEFSSTQVCWTHAERAWSISSGAEFRLGQRIGSSYFCAALRRPLSPESATRSPSRIGGSVSPATSPSAATRRSCPQSCAQRKIGREIRLWFALPSGQSGSDNALRLLERLQEMRRAWPSPGIAEWLPGP